MSELRKDYATNTWVEALSDSDGSSLADLLRESLRRLHQVVDEVAGEKVRFPGYELAAVFHGPSRPFDFLDGGIDVVWVLEAEPEMRHAPHPADGFAVPLEDDHVARPGRLPLDRPRFSVDL